MSTTSKPFDFEERTFQFAKEVRLFVKTLPRNIANQEDSRQVVRASGSVGANYIEANENLGEKDLRMRLRISRKEAKESGYFLRLIAETNPPEFFEKANELRQEAEELKLILTSMIRNNERRR